MNHPISVVIRTTFDAAHRLIGHKGKCRNLHGHRYELAITIRGPVYKTSGMIVDFDSVKEHVLAHIDQEYDHALLLDIEDQKLVNLALEEVWKLTVLLGPPTVENLVARLAEELPPLLAQIELPHPSGASPRWPSVEVTRLELHETAKCSAVWEAP